MIAQYVFYAVVAIATLATTKVKPEGSILMESSFDRHNASSRIESSNLYLINERNLLMAPLSWNRYFDKRAFTASMGLGYRHVFDHCIVGINSFFDISNKSTTYQLQNSVGIEFMTDLFELRFNLYRPWERDLIARRNYSYAFPKTVDAYLLCKVGARTGIFFNPILTSQKDINSIKVGVEYRFNDYTDISLYAGRDLNRHGILGVTMRFGLYDHHHYVFSPIKRRYDIHFIKTAIKKPPVRVSSISPPTPAIPALELSPAAPCAPPPEPVEPTKSVDKDPFFLWRWLGFSK
jgi:hypothetical protein